MSGKTQLERAINQIQDKTPLPEIDFTQHQLDNGYTISTQERVVKEVCPHGVALIRSILTHYCYCTRFKRRL